MLESFIFINHSNQIQQKMMMMKVLVQELRETQEIAPLNLVDLLLVKTLNLISVLSEELIYSR